MFAVLKRPAIITATICVVLSGSDCAHSQSAPPGRIVPGSENEVGSRQGPPTCGTEMKAEAVRQRFTSGKAPSPKHPSTDPQNDRCGPIGTPVAGFGSVGERIQGDLLALGPPGETISRVRDQVLKILENENGCTAWFQEVDPDPAGTFRSLNFMLDENGPSYVFAIKEIGQAEIFKHPYVARSWENAGRNATIHLNPNGAFFKRASAVLERDRKGGPLGLGGLHELRVATYSGNSAPAQITALLHELGHITGRLPEDDDSLDGQSGRNTAEVLRHCRSETRKPPRVPRSH